MNVLYYYYYLFYSKILRDNEPHLLTTLALSFSISLPFNVISDILLKRYYCITIGKWPMLGALLFILGINYLYFHRTGKAKEIVKTKPMFYSNHRLSILITILFFIITISFLFWGPIYAKYILEHYCR